MNNTQHMRDKVLAAALRRLNIGKIGDNDKPLGVSTKRKMSNRTEDILNKKKVSNKRKPNNNARRAMQGTERTNRFYRAAMAFQAAQQRMHMQ